MRLRRPPAHRARFNPRPSLLTSEWLHDITHLLTTVLFQSTPVIADERMAAAMARTYSAGGFNPRPSLLTSEWLSRALSCLSGSVSIHARHC